MCARPSARGRGKRQAVLDHRGGDPQIIPPAELATLVDNIGMPFSGINFSYNNTGAIGSQDGDIQIKLTRTIGRPPITSRACARSFRGAFPGDLRFSARRHRQPDPEFRRAGADRPAGRAARPRRELRLRQPAAGQLRHIPGIADARIQQSPAPVARHRRRSHARPIHRRDRGATSPTA